MLARLHREGYRQAVCSNSIRESVKLMIHQSGLDDYFELLLRYGMATSFARRPPKENEMGVNVKVTAGPAIERAGDLAAILTNLRAGDVLFIDEVHRLGRAVEEVLYPAMEDFKIDFTLDSGLHARVMTYHLRPFTLIGATTRAGLLTGALRSRFGITHHLQFYSEDDLLTILHRAASLLHMNGVSEDALHAIARRSRHIKRAVRLSGRP